MAPVANAFRGMIEERLERAGAVFEERATGRVALHFGDPDAERESAARLAVVDLSALPRTGFKGRDAPGWLREQGVELPERPNRVALQDDGSLAASLSLDEHLVLSGPAAACTLTGRLDDAWRFRPGRMCYHLPRMHGHCWFLVTGARVEAMLAKVCGVDLRARHFGTHSVAQTSVARIDAIVVKDARYRGFHVLTDSPSAEYLWDCLLDAMAEWSGTAVGVAAVRGLAV